MPGGKNRSPSTRGRSPSMRSYSPSRRSRSRSYSDYSDSFYSDDSYDRRSRKPSQARNAKSNASSVQRNQSTLWSAVGRYSSPRKPLQSVYKSTAKAKKKPMGKKGPPGKKGGGGAVSPRNMDYVTKRMLSARRIKINELKNETDDLAKQLQELQTENRTLRRDQIIREKQLDKYEYQENDMANVLQKHNSEVRVLKETLRKNKDKNHKLEQNLKSSEEELERTKKLLKKMKGLVEDKELAERDELARKLSKAESLLDEKDKRVKDLERHVDHLTKNHKHEMGIERARHKDTNRQLKELQEKYDQIQIQLREKEKEIEVKNIYANRMLKPPHHLNNSVSSSPAPPKAIRERKNSEPSVTPREKAKMFEQKRREEQRKKKEERDKKEAEIREKKEEEDRAERERLEEIERERRAREEEIDQTKREEREWRERKDRERKDRESRERREREEEERRRKREEEEEERKWKEERERRKREADELFNKQKRDKDDRERREREEKERFERQAREHEEIERRAQEERFRLDYDQAEQEKKRQRELLLAKMKAIDDGPAKAQQDNDLFSLSKGKTVTKEKSNSLFGNGTHNKKDYNFTRPIENMHSGKPAYETTGSAKKNRMSLFDSDDSDGGYNPSFGTSRRGNTKQVKKDSLFDSPVGSAGKSRTNNNTIKGDLMTNLFGSSATTKPKSTTETTKDLEFTFNTSPKKTVPSTTKRDNSTTQIYGGGSAFLDGDSETPERGSGLLPRRMKQPATTIHNRPTVNAVDDVEDDIEEVIL